MKLSHSKLSCILNDPMTYYLKYVVGISLMEERPALAIGSAVHWGIEHNTNDLSEYYFDRFKTRDDFNRDQFLAEAMIHGYFKHKEEIFNDFLIDENGEKLELLDEVHELEIEAKLKSNCGYDHTFLGIIDLLLVTNKGLIIIDYKTSSSLPNFDQYLDQIYRYIFLCKSVFPNEPIIKIGIINIQKTKIRQKINESNYQFLRRLQFEYELNDEKYINHHIFNQSELNPQFIQDYFDNLTRMADFAQTIDETKTFFVNYNSAIGPYGKCDFYDIFYHTPDAHVLYKITDKWIDEDGNIVDTRPCKPIDMDVVNLDRLILNKYDKFVELYNEFIQSDKLSFFNFLDYLGIEYDVDLIKTYVKIAGILNLKIKIL